MSDDTGVARDELPLPDYDHLPLPALTSRIRSLESAELERLLAYERQHGDRLPVVQVLQNRLEALAGGAEPSPGSATSVMPEHPGDTSTGSPVSPSTAGPPVNPPSQGDPTNPAQPRT